MQRDSLKKTKERLSNMKQKSSCIPDDRMTM